MNFPVYLGCGMLAGVIAGYLGLGGGIIMVPYLTLLVGLDIKEAVPISVTAIAANSVAVGSEYLKKDLVDLPMSVRLGVTVILGFATGSMLINYVPSTALRMIFAILLLYTAYNLAFKKKSDNGGVSEELRPVGLSTLVITYFAGIVAALLGLGGGVIMVPALYLLGHADLAHARGTWTFTYGFAAVAALMVFLMHGQLQLNLVAPVIMGILIGGKIGGRLGRSARPTPVKILFVVVIVYSAIKLGWPVVKGIL